MNVPRLDNPQLPRRPRPSIGLLFSTLALFLLVLIASAGLLLFAWSVREYSLIAAVFAGCCVIILLLLASLQYRAVFRIRHGASVWSATLLLMAGSLGVGFTLLTCATTKIRIEQRESLAFFVMVALTPFFFICSAQMHAWSERLRYYHTFKPFCGPCGYNLLGSIAAGALRCPECGAVIPYEKVSRYRPLREPENQPDADHYD